MRQCIFLYIYILLYLLMYTKEQLTVIKSDYICDQLVKAAVYNDVCMKFLYIFLKDSLTGPM